MRRSVPILMLMLLTVLLQPSWAQEPDVDPAPPPEPTDRTTVDQEPEQELVITRGDRVSFGDRLVVPAGALHRGPITCLAGWREPSAAKPWRFSRMSPWRKRRGYTVAWWR
jgi:hypothetical protein